MEKIQFDYYRGMEAEQYSFYRVPKILFTAECFKELSCEAKVLYGLLLDRMSLSMKNHWLDEEERVYIIFTVEEIAELLNCGTQKAVKLLKELDSEKGIGLIEKKRLGLGRPNVIYVKNFLVQKNDEENSDTSDLQNCENHNSGVVKTTIQEYPKSQFKNDENHNSGVVKTTIQECPKSQSNNTDINKTENNETESGNILSNLICPEKEKTIDEIEQRNTYREIIRENISYECFRNDTPHAREEVDELVELMVEVMVMPDQGKIRIAGEDKLVSLVKSQFMKLTHAHIEYVCLCLNKNTTKVGNIKSYLLTALYNSVLTINHYYQAEVNHDLYGGGWGK